MNNYIIERKISSFLTRMNLFKMCKYCNKFFCTKIEATFKRRKYCSYDCANSAYKITFKGNRNPFYNKKHSDKTKMLLSESHKGSIGWNKGLTKYTNKSLLEGSKKISKTRKLRFKSGLIKHGMLRKKFPELSKQKIESNNPNWKGGVSSMYYMRIAKTLSKECVECNSTENLVIHHIDMNRKNNNINNLQMLCRNCHTLKHRNINPSTRYDYIIFNEKLKDKIRYRDNYCCNICNKHQNELKYKLAVHHIDLDKQNNTFENLISLCRSCHTKVSYEPMLIKTIPYNTM